MSEVQFEKFDTLYELRVKYPQGKDDLVMVAGVLRKWDAGSKDWVVYVDDVKGDYRLYDFIGDGIVRGDLHVAGKLRAYDVEPACKGLFQTEEDLKDSYERGRKGDWACVGKEAPYLIYIWDRYWKRTEASWSPEVSLNPYATLEDLAAEADTRKQADDSLAQDIADLNDKDVLIAQDIAILKERNNAEIPAYTGVVESATIKSGSVTQYSGVHFIKSEGRFAAKQGSEYFANWLAYGGYQAQQVYHQDNKAVPNRLYNLIALSGGGLHYFDGTSFKVVNDNAGVEKAINDTIVSVDQIVADIDTLSTNDKAHDESLKILNSSVNTIIENIGNINNSITNHGKEITGLQTELDEQVGQILTISTNLIKVNASITNLQETVISHDGTLTTHTKQITTLQTRVQEVMATGSEQQTAINSQGTRLTEVEHRSDEYDTQIGLLQNEVTALQQTIRDLTVRIEALERGGGGSSSADVEDGTLSASASVVNEVMSVQGSVEDGILKL